MPYRYNVATNNVSPRMYFMADPIARHPDPSGSVVRPRIVRDDALSAHKLGRFRVFRIGVPRLRP